MLCDYGCGQPGKYQFKNSKWCCSKGVSGCPSIRKKISKKTKNKKVSKKTRKKQSESRMGKVPWNKGKIGVQENPFKGTIGRYSEETLEKMSISSKMSKEQKLNLKIMNRRTIDEWKKKYPTFAKIEEMRYNPDKPGEKEIQVHCKNHNCKNSKEKGGWFTPKTYDLFVNRIWAIEKKSGNDASYYYCSKECRQECPLFNLRSVFNEETLYTNEEYQIWRLTVLERENYICEYCDELATDVHHSRPQKLEPGFVLDPDFGIACCEKHHYQYGHKKGTECSTGNLAHLNCS